MSISTPFIQPPGRDLAVHGGARAGRPRRLSAAAGRAAAARRLSRPSTSPGKLPGASPETMATTVAQPLERQFAQIPGVAQMTSVSVLGSTQITVQFDLDRNIDAAAGDIQAAINAAGGAVAEESAVAADLLEGQPVRRADHDPGGAIRRDAADRRGRLRRHRAVAADLADCRRRAGVHRRRAEARGPRAGRSGEARRHGPDAGGRARPVLVNATVDAPKGTHRRRAPSLHALRQRPADQGRRVRQRRPRLIATARRSGCAISAGRSMRPENALARRLAERQARHPADHLQAARRQRDRHGGADQGRAAAAGGVDPAVRSSHHHHRPHADDPRLGRRRAVHADAVDRAWS